jgi:hypothetical protein
MTSDVTRLFTIAGNHKGFAGLNAVFAEFSQSVQAEQAKLWPAQHSKLQPANIGVPHGVTCYAYICFFTALSLLRPSDIHNTDHFCL